MQAIPHYYGVELHHLAPNSISQATIFAVVCEGYLGGQAPLEAVAPPLQGGAFRQEGGRERSAAGGACWELHNLGAGKSRGSVHPSPTDFIEQQVARRVLLPAQ
jgi:hypothetical protein